MKLWQLKEVLATAGVPQLAELARECLYLKSSRTSQEKLALGESRLGGSPDLPPGFEWPLYFGEPLPLLAQLDMAAISGDSPFGLLPTTGWLLVFGSPRACPTDDDSAGKFPFHVVLVDCPREALTKVEPPRVSTPPRRGLLARLFSRKEEPEERYLPCSLKWSREWNVPLDERIQYTEMVEKVHELLAHERGDSAHHQMLGWPSNLEGSVVEQTREEWSKTHPGLPDDWELLLQLDSDREMDFMWGDAGLMYFMIRREDLRAGRFDRCVCTEQCC